MKVQLFVPGAIFTTNKERKINHFARAQLVEPLRTTAKLLTLNLMRAECLDRIDGPVSVSFIPYQGRGVLADTGNHYPACKAVLDGVVDAKLIGGDSPEFVTVHCYYPPRKQTTTGILITLWPDEPDTLPAIE